LRKKRKKKNKSKHIFLLSLDDIILAAPSDQTSMILDIFNSFHNRLQFTMKFENDRKLNFMDLMMSGE